MHRFIVERLIQSVVIVALVSVIVFLFVHASGDPAALLVLEQASAADAANYRKALGLDRPIYEQFVQFMSQFWFSDTVKSFRFQQPLLPLVLQHLKFTLILAGLNVAWWTATFPGIAIALVVLAANFMGDSLRDRLDPALRNNT